jgi:hypothetical protein
MSTARINFFSATVGEPLAATLLRLGRADKLRNDKALAIIGQHPAVVGQQWIALAPRVCAAVVGRKMDSNGLSGMDSNGWSEGPSTLNHQLSTINYQPSPINQSHALPVDAGPV